MIAKEVGGTTYYTVNGVCDLEWLKRHGADVLLVERWKPGTVRIHVRFSFPHRAEMRLYYCADDLLRQFQEAERVRVAAEIASWDLPKDEVERDGRPNLGLGEHVCAAEAPAEDEASKWRSLRRILQAPPGTSVLDRAAEVMREMGRERMEAAHAKAAFDAELDGMASLRAEFGARPDETASAWIERLYRSHEDLMRLLRKQQVRVEEAVRDTGQPVLRCRICGRTVDRTREPVHFVEGGTCDCDECNCREK
ncbi:MAG: hypothetical protein WC683_01070 [bacterium]